MYICISSPCELSESVGVSNFTVINLEMLTLFVEHASLESQVPRYFQLSNLYEIADTKSLTKGLSWAEVVGLL